MIRRLKKELSPEALRQAGEDATCEQVLEACETPKSQAEDAAYYEALAQNIRETAALSDDSIQECLAVAGIPATLQNIREMKRYLAREMPENDALFTREESEAVIEALDQPEELEGLLDTLDNEHLAKVESQKQAEDITYDTLQNLIQMAGSISFTIRCGSRQIHFPCRL